MADPVQVSCPSFTKLLLSGGVNVTMPGLVISYITCYKQAYHGCFEQKDINPLNFLHFLFLLDQLQCLISTYLHILWSVISRLGITEHSLSLHRNLSPDTPILA